MNPKLTTRRQVTPLLITSRFSAPFNQCQTCHVSNSNLAMNPYGDDYLDPSHRSKYAGKHPAIPVSGDCNNCHSGKGYPIVRSGLGAMDSHPSLFQRRELESGHADPLNHGTDQWRSSFWRKHRCARNADGIRERETVEGPILQGNSAGHWGCGQAIGRQGVSSFGNYFYGFRSAEPGVCRSVCAWLVKMVTGQYFNSSGIFFTSRLR